MPRPITQALATNARSVANHLGPTVVGATFSEYLQDSVTSSVVLRLYQRPVKSFYHPPEWAQLHGVQPIHYSNFCP